MFSSGSIKIKPGYEPAAVYTYITKTVTPPLATDTGTNGAATVAKCAVFNLQSLIASYKPVLRVAAE